MKKSLDQILIEMQLQAEKDKAEGKTNKTRATIIYIVMVLLVTATVAFILKVTVFAAFNQSVYGSVTDKSSNVHYLVNYYTNSENFNPAEDYICFRSDRYDYYLVYGDITPQLTANEVKFYKYSLNSLTDEYVITEGSFQNWKLLNPDNYTYVSSKGLQGMAADEFRQAETHKVITFILGTTIFICLSTLTFEVYRSVRKQ